MRERTAHANQLHGFLLEYGIESPKGVGALRRRLADVLEDAENELPFAGRALLFDLGGELRRLNERVCAFDARIAAIAQAEPACRDSRDRSPDLDGPGGVGGGREGVQERPGTRRVARPDAAAAFDRRSAQVAWHQQAGDRYPRCPLIHGVRAALRQAGRHGDRRGRWAIQVEHRLGRNIAAVALANKNVRVAGRFWPRGADFDREHRGKAA